MPYRYLEDIAIADAAFEAWGQTPEEMIAAACDAVLNIMVSDPESVQSRDHRQLQIREVEPDMLLFRILQELIYLKDAEKLLLRARTVLVQQGEDGWSAMVEAWGEPIDPHRHDLIVDVKAVTLHRFCVQQTEKGWKATVVVDV